DTATLRLRGEALPVSPQVFDGLTESPVTLTGCGSCTITNFGVTLPVAAPLAPSVVLPQPFVSDWSIADDGPQPKPVKSGPLKSVTAPRPESEAKSRRSTQF